MTDQAKRYSWFLDNIFGIERKSGEISTLLNSHKNNNELKNVANRLWFIDLLRYRTIFSPGNVVPDEVYEFLKNEALALQQYLLFTCIDALSEETDFITFPDWLNIKNTNKKNKYKINDDDIKTIMGTDNISEPDNFRFVAQQVFQKCYQPIYGNKISINNFLLNLPEELKKELAELYVIIKTTKPLDYFMFDQDGNLIATIDNWDLELRKWEALDLDIKINLLADYYYKVLRNPYTHSAKTPLQKPLPYHSTFPKEGINLVYDYYPEAKYLVQFRQKNIEDEFLIIRLIVIIGWLAKVGYRIDEELINKFRKHQLRREHMFYSSREVQNIQRLANIYKNESYTELTQFNPRWPLAKFYFTFLTKLKSYLNPTTPLEKGFIGKVDSLIERLQVLNNLIEEQNQKYIPKNTFIPTEEERKTLEVSMPIAFDFIKQNISQVDIECKCHEILEFLDELSEWILE
jgi:hypothetical protein